MHVLGKLLVLGTVRLIHEDKDVVAVGQDWIFLGLVVPELMYQGEDIGNYISEVSELDA